MSEISTYGSIADIQDETGNMGKRPRTIGNETALYTPSLATEDGALFANFEGYWLLNSIDDWQCATVLYFFVSESDNRLKVKAYTGLQILPRALNANDAAPPPAVFNIPLMVDATDPTGLAQGVDTCNIKVLSNKALRLFNFRPVLSSDSLASTFTIQNDNNVAYAYPWSDWDGTSDNPTVGYVETMMRYVRVGADVVLPQIQPVGGPFTKNYLSARNAFEYARDYYRYLAMPQKVITAAWPAGTIANYLTIADTIENVGVERVSVGSDEKRGGKYVGIWRTKIDNKYPVTTIHTKLPHRLTVGSLVTISGLLGAYSGLNGEQKVAAWPPTNYSYQPGEPWVKSGSTQYPIHILYNSVTIKVEYDPTLHGIPTLVARHGPLTVTSGYRETIAAIYDMLLSSFGPQSHTRIRPYRHVDSLVLFETWAEMAAAKSIGKATQFTVRTRATQGNNYQLYWNPYVRIGDSLAFAPFELNDPFNLSIDYSSGNFKYDIDKDNYLDPARIYSMFFTVTGSTLTEEPITSRMKIYGYSSEGSVVKCCVNAWGVYPADLVDEYGRHPWMLYGAASSVPAEREVAKHSFFGGIIKQSLTPGRTIAYIRIGSENAMDAPLYQITVRPLAFKMSNNIILAKSNLPWMMSFAALIEKLNAQGATKFIIDSRNNGGGFAQAASAIATLFGDVRFSSGSAIVKPNNDTPNSYTPLVSELISTYGEALLGNPLVLACDEALAAFPNGVVRNKDVVFLNSVNASSGGDQFPHYFIGSNVNIDGTPPADGWDIGGGVNVKFVGNVDGRLSSGVKLYDLPPRSSAGSGSVPYSLSGEAGLLEFDEEGNSYAISQPYLAPQILMPGWHDDTTWPDLGVSPPKVPFPLGALRSAPVYRTKSTWRDSWLEKSIATLI